MMAVTTWLGSKARERLRLSYTPSRPPTPAMFPLKEALCRSVRHPSYRLPSHDGEASSMLSRHRQDLLP